MGDLLIDLDPDIDEKIQYLIEKGIIVDKTKYIISLISRSLSEDLVDYLCQQIQAQKISAWKAAEIAKISLRSMLKELAARDIPSYDGSAYEEDLNF